MKPGGYNLCSERKINIYRPVSSLVEVIHMMGQPPQQQGPPQQYGQQQYVQPMPQYPVHPAPHKAGFKLPKLVGYILVMVGVMLIPAGMMMCVNADDADDIQNGMNVGMVGVLLTSVFTMLFLAIGDELDKYEKLGLLLFLGIVVSAAMNFNIFGNLF
jgi:hypothetical protein